MHTVYPDLLRQFTALSFLKPQALKITVDSTLAFDDQAVVKALQAAALAEPLLDVVKFDQTEKVSRITNSEAESSRQALIKVIKSNRIDVLWGPDCPISFAQRVPVILKALDDVLCTWPGAYNLLDAKIFLRAELKGQEITDLISALQSKLIAGEIFRTGHQLSFRYSTLGAVSSERRVLIEIEVDGKECDWTSMVLESGSLSLTCGIGWLSGINRASNMASAVGEHLEAFSVFIETALLRSACEPLEEVLASIMKNQFGNAISQEPMN
jgi:hypothetical protein